MRKPWFEFFGLCGFYLEFFKAALNIISVLAFALHTTEVVALEPR